jgi:hypothetical protein
MPWQDPYDEESEKLDPLPRAEWCKHCLQFAQFAEGMGYHYDALRERRAAKARMKRAFKIFSD